MMVLQCSTAGKVAWSVCMFPRRYRETLCQFEQVWHDAALIEGHSVIHT